MSESVLERSGCPIHYWSGGPDGRPLVVFTHGAGVDHHSFDPITRAVTERYSVMTWDVRGHGLSQPMGQKFTIPLAVDDLVAILDTLGREKAVLVGHSNGSYIAQELAFRQPQRVQALVIVDGTCITWSHGPVEMFLLRHSAAFMRLLPFEMLKKAGLKAFSRKQEVREYVYQAFSQIPKRNFVQIWDGVVKGLHAEPGYRIVQPLLLVHGDDDRTGDIRKIAPIWARREPNCTYVVIPNARHFAILDNADFFNRILMEFLAKWVPAAPAA